MSRTKNRNRSELEYLRGEIRRLEAELKYYKRRAHFEEETKFIKEGEDHNCPSCGKSKLIEYDFKYIILTKCGLCGYEERKTKKFN